MDKFLVGGVFLFVVTEVLCMVALLTPDWIVSDFAGTNSAIDHSPTIDIAS